MIRRRLATFALTLGLALGAPALGVVAGTAPLACAATDQRAALVVDTGSQARSYCVALGADAVSGTDLIRLAHEQYGLDYRLGYGGRAICRLAGVGVDGADCFGAFPDFWGYWHGDAGGGWTWAGGSAADWTVEAGDVEGWQWGPGQDGDTHAAPPATRLEDVCEPAPPSPPPSTGGGGDHDNAENGGGGRQGDGTTAGPSPAPSVSDPTPSGEDREPRDRNRHDASPAPSPTGGATPSPTGASPVVLAAGDGSSGTTGGGSAGSLMAGVAVVILGAAGAAVLRRRRAV